MASANDSGGIRLGAALIATAALLLVFVARETAKSSAELEDTDRWVRHTLGVQVSIEHLVGALSRTDSSARTFALTGQERYARGFAANRAESAQELTRLADLIDDNSTQVGRVGQLRPLIDQKFGRDQALIDLRRSQGLAAASAAMAQTFPQAETPEAMTGVFRQMRADESRLLQERTEASALSRARATRVQEVGGVIAAGLIALACAMAVRARMAQKAAARALAEARDQAIEASRLKSDFLASMSHEIRTPMNGVIGMTSLLLETPMSPEQREYLETIRTSGDTLLVLVSDILDFSKIEAGKFELEKEEFDLVAAVEDSLALFKGKAREKDLELLYEMQPGVPQTVVGDVTRLRQILTNLVGNALKFTSRGEIGVTVQAEEQPDGCLLRFQVRDTGIGIPADRLERLFQPFTQADASTSRRYGGTGLGLAISKRLCELMGGTMGVSSKEGAGSTFTFTLKAGVAAKRRSVTLGGASLAGRRLLVVDDNGANRRILRQYLEGWGMACTEAASGDEALSRLSADRSIDGCLLDMHMAPWDGLALAGKIRSMAENGGLPLILLTSDTREKLREPAAAVGIASVLDKPIRQSALYRALADAFAARLPGLPTELSDEVAQRGDGTFETNLSLLLAEDNLVNQRVAQHMLRKLGLSARVAADGGAVLEAAREQAFDVILMDMQMPGMDGIEATRAIRASDLPRQPYIIAMTANALPQDRDACRQAGMNDYLTKPMKLEDLRAALRRAAQGQPAAVRT